MDPRRVCAWTVWVWVTFMWIIDHQDHPIGFKVVHGLLANDRFDRLRLLAAGADRVPGTGDLGRLEYPGSLTGFGSVRIPP